MQLLLRVLCAGAVGVGSWVVADPGIETEQRVVPKVPTDGRVRVGDTLKVETTVRNTGDAPAQGVVVRNPVPENASEVEGSLKSTPLARDDQFSCLGNIGLTIPATDGVLKNDFDLGPVTPEVVEFEALSEAGGKVQVSADGSFEYDPPVGFTGTDQFRYTIKDENAVELPEPVRGSNKAAVLIVVSQSYWFVDSESNADPLGTLERPFHSLQELQASESPGEGDVIVLLGGADPYQGPLTLQLGQRLIGQGVRSWQDHFGVMPLGTRTLPEAGGVVPVVESSTGDGIVVIGDNVVAGIEIGSVAGVGLSGQSVGTLQVEEVSKSGAGGGVRLSGEGEVSVVLTSLAATSSTHPGIYLRDVSGRFSVVGGGTIATTGTVAVDIDAPIDLGQTTLTRIDVEGGPTALRLRQAAGEFRVLGDKSTSLGGNGSGGVFRDCTGVAVAVRMAGSVYLQNIRIEGGGEAGESAVILHDVQGAHRFVGMTVQGLKEESGSALHVAELGDEATVLASQWVVSGKASGVPAFLIEQKQGEVAVEHSRIEDCDGDAVFVFAAAEGAEQGPGAARFVFRSNRVENARGSGAVHVHDEDGVRLRATIEANEFLGVAQGNANAGIISMSGGGDGPDGVLQAVIRDNRIDGNGVADFGGGKRRGISLLEDVANGVLSSFAAIVSGNEIDDLPEREALFAETRSHCELFELSILDNRFGVGAEVGTTRYLLGGARDGVFLEHDGAGGSLVVLMQNNEVACSSASGPEVDQDAILDVNADRPQSVINLTMLGNLFESSRNGQVVLEADVSGAQLNLDLNAAGTPRGRNGITTGLTVLHGGDDGGIRWEGLAGSEIPAARVLQFLNERNDFTSTVDDRRTYEEHPGAVPVPVNFDGGDP